MKTIIISAFPGTGKTYFYEKYKNSDIKVLIPILVILVGLRMKTVIILQKEIQIFHKIILII